MPNHRRTFDREFKLQVLRELDAGASIAQAARDRFGKLSTSSEVGCEIYCNADGCGYRAPVAGNAEGVDITYDSEAVGNWHTHPSWAVGHDITALGHHTEELNHLWWSYKNHGLTPPSTLYVFTTLTSDNTTWEQDYCNISDWTSSAEPFQIP